MKITRTLICITVGICLYVATCKIFSVISEIKYIKIITDFHLTTEGSIKDYYAKNGELPPDIAKLEHFLPERFFLNNTFYKNLYLENENCTVTFTYAPKNSWFIEKWNDKHWGYSQKSKNNYLILFYNINIVPELKYRFYKTISNESVIIEKIEANINNTAKEFTEKYAKSNYYIYDNPANITFYYSKQAKSYFYYPNYHELDSMGDLYLFKLRYAISEILIEHNIEKVQIPLNLPHFSPIPPPRYP